MNSFSFVDIFVTVCVLSTKVEMWKQLLLQQEWRLVVHNVMFCIQIIFHVYWYLSCNTCQHFESVDNKNLKLPRIYQIYCSLERVGSYAQDATDVGFVWMTYFELYPHPYYWVLHIANLCSTLLQFLVINICCC